MKTQLFAIGMFALAMGSGLRAESANLKAQIPFGFAMNGAAMPAGEYIVTLTDNGVVVLRERSGKGAALALTSPTLSAPRGGEASTTPRLLFKQYGDEHFLCGVW